MNLLQILFSLLCLIALRCNVKNLFDEIVIHFAIPSSRLRLIALLNIFTTAPSFSSAAKILPKHPLMLHLLYSLFFDTSSTAATLGITLLVKVLPFLAAHARHDLKAMLPKLLAILARIMCWKERPASKNEADLDETIDADFERELECETNPVPVANPDIQWARLEMSFRATSLPPSSRNYFTMLYYLFPSNLLTFLRSPAQYLINSGVPSPYMETWDHTFNEDKIHRRSKVDLLLILFLLKLNSFS
jgi:hypothetical protein